MAFDKRLDNLAIHLLCVWPLLYPEFTFREEIASQRGK
jgi:hypothetical protein